MTASVAAPRKYVFLREDFLLRVPAVHPAPDPHQEPARNLQLEPPHAAHLHQAASSDSSLDRSRRKSNVHCSLGVKHADTIGAMSPRSGDDFDHPWLVERMPDEVLARYRRAMFLVRSSNEPLVILDSLAEMKEVLQQVERAAVEEARAQGGTRSQVRTGPPPDTASRPRRGSARARIEMSSSEAASRERSSWTSWSVALMGVVSG